MKYDQSKNKKTKPTFSFIELVLLATQKTIKIFRH